MPSFDYGYGPTPEEFEEFTNRQVTNLEEFKRQRARAQETFDAVAGNWPDFHDRNERTLQFTNTTSETFTSTNLNSSKDDYYNHMELRVVQGNGSGFRGYIADYDGTTKTATVSGVAGDFSNVDTDSRGVLKDIAVFPRAQDIDADSRPRYPESLPRIVAYIIEYWVNLEDQEGFNADTVANAQPEVIQETLGDWQTTYKASRDPVLQMIGPKAYEIARREGLLRRTAGIRRLRSTPFAPDEFNIARRLV